MGKSLVIVESPAKAKTINKYLGKEYIVKSSVGHIRDLPTGGSIKSVDPKARAKAAAITRKMSPKEKEKHKKKKAKEQLINRMGINPDNNWEARYEILPGKTKVVADLKKYAEKSDTIFLATDLDREGEAIAWHLREAIGGDEKRYKRVVFNEITKRAIKEAFAVPGELDLNRVNAQQTRRFLDRIVGFMVSPLLWAKIARGLSAGRVQSVAVKLVSEREKEIHAFNPEEYWEVHADLKAVSGETVKFQVKKEDDKTFRPGSREQIDTVLKVLEKADYKITKRDDKPTKSNPYPPFITSTLQQWASTRLGFSVKKIMVLAQKLYEAGHITYMRTDSTNISLEAIESCRNYISEKYGKRYLPEKPRVYSSKAGAQEAHEAIRPSDVFADPSVLAGLERDQLRLYSLIWNQFVACQMPSAEFQSTGVTVTADKFELKTRGRVITFDGFMKIINAVSKKENDINLPDLKVGDNMDLLKLIPGQHFTKPAARYTEASLVKELEKKGIGRPSTYASIISTIQERGYVKLLKKRFYAEKMGHIVTERLSESFTDLMNYGFTADMEVVLDDIASENANWKEVLNTFYKEFSETLQKAYKEKGGMRPNNPIPTDIKCPKCERNMQIRTAGTGVFLGCSGYGLPPKERCKSTINLIPGDEAESADYDEEEESRLLHEKRRCKICETAMDHYLLDEKRKIHICGNNPDCKGWELENGNFKLKGYDGPLLECDKCGAEMQLKSGRFGKYFGCTNQECSNTRKLLRNGQPAPPKMDVVPMPELRCQKVDDFYLLRDGAAGLFLAASKFPKNRETRAPLVAEILPHKDEIDPKYNFLFSAPTEDSKGNKAIIRYSRKTAEQYVMTEKDSKATGWKGWYKNGKWVIEEPKKR